ncbi:unnamed protein product [Ilex paraguariensis]|uniref:N-acetylglucosaminylphosphatidylinositol deacetylase n=1 Tax=Ilex paraguariensis TaxID=185542 RepID=A0ABC8U898_9AQUA
MHVNRNQVAELETPGKLLAQHSFKRPLRHFVKLIQGDIIFTYCAYQPVIQMEWGPLEKKALSGFCNPQGSTPTNKDPGPSRFAVASIIEEEVHTRGIDVVIAFDDYGVSGHCNHCDVNRGVHMFSKTTAYDIHLDFFLVLSRKLLHDTSQRNVEAWELVISKYELDCGFHLAYSSFIWYLWVRERDRGQKETWVSTSILRKYSGPADIWLSILYAMHCPNGQIHCLLNEHPHKSYAAMAQHMSQWLWYVCLLAYAFSCYSNHNKYGKEC